MSQATTLESKQGPLPPPPPTLNAPAPLKSWDHDSGDKGGVGCDVDDADEKNEIKSQSPVGIDQVSWETKEGKFQGSLSISPDKLTLNPTGNINSAKVLTISIKAVTLIDVSYLKYNSSNKLALECTPSGWSKIGLVKVWLSRLSHVDTLLDVFDKSKVRRGAISSTLHTPSLLPHYSARLRALLEYGDKIYGAVFYWSLFLYVTNVAAWLPEVSFIMLYQYGVSIFNMVYAAPWLSVFIPVLFAASTCVLPLVFSLFITRYCLTLLLSLNLVYNIQAVLSIVKKARSFVTQLRIVSKVVKAKAEKASEKRKKNE